MHLEGEINICSTKLQEEIVFYWWSMTAGLLRGGEVTAPTRCCFMPHLIKKKKAVKSQRVLL